MPVLSINSLASGEIYGRAFARTIDVKPIIIDEIATAVSGTEEMRKYASGANIAPPSIRPNPKILYGLRVFLPHFNKIYSYLIKS